MRADSIPYLASRLSGSPDRVVVLAGQAHQISDRITTSHLAVVRLIPWIVREPLDPGLLINRWPDLTGVAGAGVLECVSRLYQWQQFGDLDGFGRCPGATVEVYTIHCA